MIRAAQILTVVTAFVLLGGCRSFQVSQPGYMVQGDDYFVNIDEKLSVYLGSDFHKDTWWIDGKPPLNLDKLTSSQKKNLRFLDYKPKSHKVLFRNGENLPFGLLAVIERDSARGRAARSGQLLPVYSRKTPAGMWYYDIKENQKGQTLYHTMVPVPKITGLKYLSLIFLFDEEANDDQLNFITPILDQNVENYQRVAFYSAVRFVEENPEKKDEYHYEYVVPEFLRDRDYMVIVKVMSSSQDHRNLFYYRLLQPEWHLGAFKVYEGQYTLEVTTLEGEILHQYDFTIEPGFKQTSHQ